MQNKGKAMGHILVYRHKHGCRNILELRIMGKGLGLSALVRLG